MYLLILVDMVQYKKKPLDFYCASKSCNKIITSFYPDKIKLCKDCFIKKINEKQSPFVKGICYIKI